MYVRLVTVDATLLLAPYRLHYYQAYMWPWP